MEKEFQTCTQLTNCPTLPTTVHNNMVTIDDIADVIRTSTWYRIWDNLSWFAKLVLRLEGITKESIVG